ncbi:RNA polymerase sigma factor [Lunatimonas lonarensis]|nr:sigma-70 family RNA polymerase sigma factor [Lunatimonas lonarensis]
MKPVKNYQQPAFSEIREVPLTLPLRDKDLWDKFRSGDEGAFVVIYQGYVNHLFHFGCQFCQDRDVVKDLLQDFFIDLRANRRRLGSTDSIKFYLLKSFRRRVLGFVKKAQREAEHRKRFLMEQFSVELSTESKFIQQQLDDELIQNLNNALLSLDNKEREAIYYFYYQGLGYDQIAEIFEFSHISSARRLIYKSLAKIRKVISLSILAFFAISNRMD